MTAHSAADPRFAAMLTVAGRLGALREEVLVRDRNVPVAKIVPLSASGDLDAELAALAAEGKLRLGEGSLPRSFWSAPAPRVSKKDVLRVLRAERDER